MAGLIEIFLYLWTSCAAAITVYVEIDTITDYDDVSAITSASLNSSVSATITTIVNNDSSPTSNVSKALFTITETEIKKTTVYSTRTIAKNTSIGTPSSTIYLSTFTESPTTLPDDAFTISTVSSTPVCNTTDEIVYAPVQTRDTWNSPFLCQWGQLWFTLCSVTKTFHRLPQMVIPACAICNFLIRKIL